MESSPFSFLVRLSILLGLLMPLAVVADSSPPTAIAFDLSMAGAVAVELMVLEGDVALLEDDTQTLAVRPTILDPTTGEISLEIYSVGSGQVQGEPLMRLVGNQLIRPGQVIRLHDSTVKVGVRGLRAMCTEGSDKPAAQPTQGCGPLLLNGVCCVDVGSGRACGCYARSGGSFCCEAPCCPPAY